MATYAEIREVLARAGINGSLRFGFVMTADRGLTPEEFVVLPATAANQLGTVANPVTYAEAGIPSQVYMRRFASCLCSDFETVENLDVIAELRPMVRATRAHSYASGFLSHDNECTVGAFTGAEADITTFFTGHPDIVAAATMGIQHATFAIFCTAVNFYQTNHNTAGTTLPRGQLKAIRAMFNLGQGVSNADITHAVYLAAHATDKRLVLHGMLPPAIADQLVGPRAYGTTITPTFDQWAALRVRDSLTPAGTGTLNVLKVLLEKVIEVGLSGFSPVPEATAALQTAWAARAVFPGAYHPGARYLFNVDQVNLANVDELKGYIGTFGSFASAAGLCNSVTTAPHIATLIMERRDPAWTAVGLLVARGSAMDTDRAAAAMATAGITVGADIPNFEENPEAYAEYGAGQLAILRAL